MQQSDCHVHLYFGVWLVVMENEVIKRELVNVSHLSPDFQTRERSGDTCQLGRMIGNVHSYKITSECVHKMGGIDGEFLCTLYMYQYCTHTAGI